MSWLSDFTKSVSQTFNIPAAIWSQPAERQAATGAAIAGAAYLGGATSKPFMGPVLPTEAGGSIGWSNAAQFGLPLLSDIYNIDSQNKTNKASLDQSWQMYQQNREDQNTAVQRRAADMKAAGINPLMAAGDAAGAAQGSLAGLTAPQAKGPPIGEILSLKQVAEKNKQDYELGQEQVKLQKYANTTERMKALSDITYQIQQGKLSKVQEKAWHTNPIGFIEEYLKGLTGKPNVFQDRKK